MTSDGAQGRPGGSPRDDARLAAVVDAIAADAGFSGVVRVGFAFTRHAGGRAICTVLCNQTRGAWPTSERINAAL